MRLALWILRMIVLPLVCVVGAIVLWPSDLSWGLLVFAMLLNLEFNVEF